MSTSYFHLENCGWVVDLSRVILEILRGGSNIRIQRCLCGCLVKSLLNYWHFQNFIFRATDSGWMVDLKTELIIKSSLPQSVGCNYEEKLQTNNLFVVTYSYYKEFTYFWKKKNLEFCQMVECIRIF